MINSNVLITITLMAVVTYSCRVLGYLVLRKFNLSTRTMAVLEASPGCVLISVIAPAFVSDNPADLIALLITALAALRFSLLPTVFLGISSAALFRYLLS